MSANTVPLIKDNFRLGMSTSRASTRATLFAILAASLIAFPLLPRASDSIKNTHSTAPHTSIPARQVITTVISWYSPIGNLNGSRHWRNNGYLYRGAKESDGVQNYPLIPNSPYPQSAPEVGSSAYQKLQSRAARDELREIKSAGFDVAAYDMLPMPAFDPNLPIGSSNLPFAHFKTFLDWLAAGEEIGIKVALFADIRNVSADYPKGRSLNIDEWVHILDGALEHIRLSPAVWRIDGKPVVMHFGTDITSGAPPVPNASGPDGGWRQVLKRLRDRGQPFYFIADVRPRPINNAHDWSGVADAVHMFAPASPSSFLVEKQVEMARSFPIPFIWSVSPGYYSTNVDAYTEPDFQRIHDTYLAAMAADAKYINVLTWNDFGEDTDIAPSSNKGRNLLKVFAYYNQWFKTGVQPAVDRDTIILAYPTRMPEDIRTKAPIYGRGRWTAPNFSPKVFYWANTRTKHSLDLPKVGRVAIPAGLSFGTLGTANAGPLSAIIGNKSIDLPPIRKTLREEQNKGEGGLEYRYVQLLP